MTLSIKQKLSDARALQAGEVNRLVDILSSIINTRIGCMVTGTDEDSITIDVADQDDKEILTFTIHVIPMQNTFDACLMKVEEEQHEG